MRKKSLLMSFPSAYRVERLPALSEKSALLHMYAPWAGWKATVDIIIDNQLYARSVAVVEPGLKPRSRSLIGSVTSSGL